MEASTASTTPPAPPEPATEAHGAPQADAGAGADPRAGTGETADERDEETGRYLSREAARYRTRLRETEAERDQLRERLERYERAEVERLASAAGLAVPADLWALGTQIEHCRAEDGSIDAETVSASMSPVSPRKVSSVAPNVHTSPATASPAALARRSTSARS